MTVSYKKLWKLLIDKDMTKTDLRLAIGASSSTFSKLAHGEFVSGDLMSRICEALDCNVGDMMDIVRESPESVSMTKHTDRKLNEKA
mgnify:CR=1 FL=1